MQNDKPFTGHGWVALILLVAMLLDGTLSQVLAQWLMTPTFTGVPQLTLIALLMIALALPEEDNIVIIAGVTGLVFDSFYTGMLGVHMLLWPLLVYVIRQLAPLVPRGALYVGSVVIIALTVYLGAYYFVSRFLGFTAAAPVDLIAHHMGPGLAVNLVLFAVIYAPMMQVLNRLRPDQRA
ncbi:rod shape-determining protein MreD [Lacticaseibacillus daqingensis]|uniref:rod shape-determining protein MreD n=1 Tax=Lacticaseibacillus daqingensis TaxID=2486014 RepID=UPI000F7816FC|nr:rod shape-determining protein MreD [Lacticaseibacillus daqingensis]